MPGTCLQNSSMPVEVAEQVASCSKPELFEVLSAQFKTAHERASIRREDSPSNLALTTHLSRTP